MKLKHLGFFKELSHGDRNGPSLKELRRSEPSYDHERVATYLESAPAFIACPGIVGDVLDPRIEMIGPPHILTDGEWAWPRDLAYYVRKYYVALPPEFLEQAGARNFIPPAREEIDYGTISL